MVDMVRKKPQPKRARNAPNEIAEGNVGKTVDEQIQGNKVSLAGGDELHDDIVTRPAKRAK